MSNDNWTVVANSRLTPHSNVPINTPVPRKRPGVVIFLHGVNDPGASYESVETGLCQGLNERLDRQDLKPGVYGAEYAAAKKTPKEKRGIDEKDTLDDPDTNLYWRDDTDARSVLIPFYWGYRAAHGEVKRDAQGEPTKLRTQYQDTFGNRLDRNFGKPGGFFANATNNLPEMYGKGFDKWVRHLVQPILSNTQYMGQGPHRRYFVLAAERLATLIGTIRGAYPSETITVMGHSQGTLITLLAQALLVDRKQRCADCVIMVDSPYSILPDKTPKGSDTLGTLFDIVQQVTATPYALPRLEDMRAGEKHSFGRAGRAWTSATGQRIGKDGQVVVFPERDNRGKVYLYFSHDDSTVGISDVSGIGTLGVPDTLPKGKPAMEVLKWRRFHQRLWSKRVRDGNPLYVGNESGYEALRIQGERGGAAHVSLASIKQATMETGEPRWINGEQLFPPHAPMMFGGEAKVGSPNKAGLDRPDDVSKNVALGNPEASFKWIELEVSPVMVDAEAVRARFNEGKQPDDQTQSVIHDALPTSRDSTRMRGYRILREETPNEIRARMQADEKEWEPNSYHSGMLRHPENHRWVTAMDVAIGQAHTLDNPQWRHLLMLMANWRMDKEVYAAIQSNPLWPKLSEHAQKLVEACHKYYKEGKFPSNDLVRLDQMPSLVKGTVPVQEKR